MVKDIESMTVKIYTCLNEGNYILIYTDGCVLS